MMDSLLRNRNRNRSNSNLTSSSSLTILFLFLLLLPLVSCTGAGVFQVHHKFFGRQRSLTALKAHDTHRHRRILSAIDLPLGGNGNPNDSGLYFAKIRLGSPPKDYYVQVDTGSDILWVNCIHCTDCNKNKDTKLTLYNPKDSATGKEVSCSDDFCTNLIYDNSYPKCETDKPCAYKVLYADGSGTDGYYVRDYIQYDQPSGNAQNSPGNASVVFGCGARQSGDLGSSSQELDGILGFGQSNSSVLSQLASSGKVKKVFSHCLDAQNGGGIFAIGQVVQPKVKTTPLVPDQPHYNVNLEEIEVGKDFLDLPTDIFESGERKGTIIDSGTTLAYLPDVVYAPLIKAIMSHKPDLQLQTIEEQYQCFEYAGSVDDVFPTVTFHFKGSLTLMVYPHEYMFSTEVSRKKLWCIGWQDGSLQSKDGKYMTLLGDIVLSNKLVVYDLENQTIGWTEYNCSSSIKVLDDHSGAQYSVNAHDLSSASILEKGRMSILLLLSVMMYVIHF